MINLTVVSPTGKVLASNEVVSITLPSSEGEMMVLEDHKPLITLLKFGEIDIKDKDDKHQYITISSGVVRIEPNSNVYIMADTSEFSDQIDVEAAQQAREKAEEYLKNNKDIDDVEFARLQGNIERELARIEIGKLRNRAKTTVGVKVIQK